MKKVILAIFMTFMLSLLNQFYANRIIANRVLGPYPPLGSEASLKDFSILHHYQEIRTAEDCAEASSESEANLESMFAGKKGPLSKAEAKEQHLYILYRSAELGINNHYTKLHYGRPRPFLVDPKLIPCVPMPSNEAYPSGHAMMARYFAHILSELYPERSKAFMIRAEEVAMHRVLGGVHHPSDIIAGKKLGDAMATDLFGEKAIQRNLELIK